MSVYIFRGVVAKKNTGASPKQSELRVNSVKKGLFYFGSPRNLIRTGSISDLDTLSSTSDYVVIRSGGLTSCIMSGGQCLGAPPTYCEFDALGLISLSSSGARVN